MNSFSLSDKVDTVSFQSKSLNYENKEVGSFMVTKNTKWISKGKARINIDIDTISQIENDEKDIILVLDTSFGDNLVTIKKTLLDFIDKILSNENSRIALVTYDNSSAVRSGFTKDKNLLTNRINALTNGLGKRSYYKALVSIDSILKEYMHENGKEVTALFITNGYSNMDMSNQEGYYSYLKQQYPYLKTYLIWYGGETKVTDIMRNTSDFQFMTSISNLKITLLDTVDYTKEYDSFIFSDVINTNYFDSNSISNVKSTNGTIRMENDTVIWNLEEFHTGRSNHLTFDVSLKDTPSNEIKMISIAKENIVTYKLGELEETIINQDNIKLPTNYQVIYEDNKPSDCEIENFPSNEVKQVKEIVELSDNLKCGEYGFKGWTILTEGVESLTNNQFIMPESDVIVRAEWSKLTLEKTMDGTVLPGLPPAPVINSSKVGYPILTEYGVMIDSEVSIDFSDRDDIDNYYSIDDGATWKKYEGPFNRLSSTTIRAKSCLKDIDDDCIESSETIEIPSDALPPITYDRDYNSGQKLNNNYQTKSYYIMVDESMYNNKFLLKFGIPWYSTISVYGYDENDTETLISSYYHNGSYATLQLEYLINPGIKKVKISLIASATAANDGTTVYEIEPKTAPIIEETKYYPELTEDGVSSAYNIVKIRYFQTAARKLYRINGGEWQEYKDKEIRLEIGDQIETKGMDVNDFETPFSSYTAVLPSNSIPLVTYDGDFNTGQQLNNSAAVAIQIKEYYMSVDETMYNNKFSLKLGIPRNSTITIYGYDEDNREILIGKYNHSASYATLQFDYLIESGIKTIKFHLNSPNNGGITIYEIYPNTIPTITSTQHYPKLTGYGVDLGYNSITINYFQTSIQKLYRINGGEWKNYQDMEMRLEIGDVLEAKGINASGKETEIINYTSIQLMDTLYYHSFDGDNNTHSGYLNYYTPVEQQDVSYYLEVDNSIYNKKILIKFDITKNSVFTIYCYDENNNELSNNSYQHTGNSTSLTKEYDIVPGTKKLRIRAYSPTNGGIVMRDMYAVDSETGEWVVNCSITKPTINVTKHYATLTNSGIEQSYDLLTINYFKTVTQKLYRINDGEWQEYQEQGVKLNVGDTIEIKGIDSYGAETKTLSYTAEALEDALPKEAYDQNEETTYRTNNGVAFIDVESELSGRKIHIKGTTYVGTSDSTTSKGTSVIFYDESMTIINTDTYTLDQDGTITLDKDLTIPDNCSRIAIWSGTNTSYYIEISEISVIE